MSTATIDGASYRQLDYWVRRGYLRPEEATPGTGYARTWAPSELRVAARMARLVAAGLTLAAAEKVARASGPMDLGNGVWVGLSDTGEVA
jgi:DNA-binding transcriptional MerR regulator